MPDVYISIGYPEMFLTCILLLNYYPSDSLSSDSLTPKGVVIYEPGLY